MSSSARPPRARSRPAQGRRPEQRRRGLHCNNVNLPRVLAGRRRCLDAACLPSHHPEGGTSVGSVRVLAGDDQAGFGQRPARPGELLPVPAGERRHGDAVAGGVDEPAVAEVDPGVVDRGRLRARAGGPKKSDVAGRELGERDPLRAATSPLIW